MKALNSNPSTEKKKKKRGHHHHLLPWAPGATFPACHYQATPPMPWFFCPPLGQPPRVPEWCPILWAVSLHRSKSLSPPSVHLRCHVFGHPCRPVAGLSPLTSIEVRVIETQAMPLTLRPTS
jgi:hypothetical protein